MLYPSHGAVLPRYGSSPALCQVVLPSKSDQPNRSTAHSPAARPNSLKSSGGTLSSALPIARRKLNGRGEGEGEAARRRDGERRRALRRVGSVGSVGIGE